jgi:hypothetical protein
MNDFKITISAIDRSTAVVRKINNEFSQLVRPIVQVGRSTKALGRELGLQKMAASIGKVAKNARSAAGEVTKIGAPLLALVGGGSLIGIAMLAEQWARLGFEVARTSETLGLSSSMLQGLRGAAELAGVSSAELTSGVKSLGDTMEDALYGRNQQALAVLNKLGITIHKTADGAIDSARGMMDLADAIAKIKSPQVQGLVARQFGVEALLPLLRKGSAAIAEYQRKAAELGAVMTPAQIARAEQFGIAIKMLELAGQGLKNTIGDALIPAFQPLIEQLTAWISLNRTAIGEKVGKWAKDFAAWIASIDFKALFDGIGRTIEKIAAFVDSIGGWKVVAIGVAAVMAGPLILAISNIGLGLGMLALRTIPLAIRSLALLGTAMGATGSAGVAFGAGLTTLGAVGIAGLAGYGAGMGINWLMDKAGVSPGAGLYNKTHPEENAPKETGSTKRVVSFFEKQGWTKDQAIGIAANLKRESGFNSDIVGDNGHAFGVAQWHRDRQERFKHWAHKDIRQSTLDEQLGFVNYELTQGTEKGAGDALRNAKDEKEAAHVVRRLYERPANGEKEDIARGDIASTMRRQLVDGVPMPAAAPADATAPNPAPAPQPTDDTQKMFERMQKDALQSMQPQEVKHDIAITLHGIPQGVTATARKADGTPLRVATAMPGVSP